MKKKTKVTASKSIELPAPTASKVEEIAKLGKLELNFGREDLNLLATKINEIIDAL